MVNKKTWLGILAVVLVFEMTVVGCEAQSNVGKFTLTNIPEKYNGKYVLLAATNKEDSFMFALFGGENIDIDPLNPQKQPLKLSLIKSGSVILPMWIMNLNGEFEKYSGNDTADVEITIFEEEDGGNNLEDIYFTVTFSNGGAKKSYNDRSNK
jgi:hypothetical protein